MTERKPEANKPGRPKLPKGKAEGTAMQVRVNSIDRKRVEASAKGQTISHWIREA